MKLKNKKIIYGLGGFASIIPISIVGFNQINYKEENNYHNQDLPSQFLFKQVAGLPNGINYVIQTKSNKIFASAGNDGLWVSIDGGVTFTKTGIDEFYADIAVLTICQMPNGKIFVGTDRGLCVSTDDGASFNWIEMKPETLNRWAIGGFCVTSSGELYVAAISDGLWLSTDGGNTFSEVDVEGLYSYQQVKWIYKTNDGKIFIGTNLGLKVSNDNAGSFYPIKGPLSQVKEVESFCESSDHSLFVGTRDSGIYESRDNGISFYKNNNWPVPEKTAIIMINMGPNSETFFGTDGKGLWGSNDQGGTFVPVGPQDWNYKSAFSACQTTDGKIFVGTNDGLWVSFVGISCSFQQGANHIDSYIDEERNIISNKTIDVIITNPIAKVDVDGKSYDVSSYAPYKQSISSGKSNFTITYEDGTKYNFIVWAKNAVSIDPNNFNTDSAYNLEQYQGFLHNDENYPVQVISVTGDSGQDVLYINLSDKTIDYSKSYYQPIDESFNPKGNKTLLNISKTTISRNGLYLLNIVDVIGNTVNFYVQIGGSAKVIPNVFKEKDGFTIAPGVSIKQDYTIDNKSFDYITNGNITYICNDSKVDEIKISEFAGTTEDIKSGIFNYSKTFQVSDSITQYKITVLYKGIQIKQYNIMLVPAAINESQSFNININHGNAYKGNLKGQTCNVIGFLDENGAPKTSISLNLNLNQIDFSGKSYYQKIDTSKNLLTFEQTPITTTNPTIVGVGLYEVKLVDLFNFENIYYVQIGGNKNIIPPISSGGGVSKNSTTSNWKIWMLVVGSLTLFVLLVGLIIRYRPRKARSITNIKHKQGVISDKELEQMQKEENEIK